MSPQEPGGPTPGPGAIMSHCAPSVSPRSSSFPRLTPGLLKGQGSNAG